MKNHYPIIFAAILHLFSCQKSPVTPADDFTVAAHPPLPVEKSNPMQLWVHYMPWFDDKTTSGNGAWGWHWTMNNRNPDLIDANGQRQIASHYYPLIGPYASSDPALIEYHLLLMKYAGIDGVLIDWYGSTNVYDYGTNRRNTETLISMLDQVGLKFAIVYEDATIRSVMQNTGAMDAIGLACDDMAYLEREYFSKNTYLKINGRPLLLVFGPNYFQKASDWEKITSVFKIKPSFLSLWGTSVKLGAAAAGEYIWVDLVNIDTKYANRKNFATFLGGAWPGFHDFYLEGNAGANLFVIHPNNGVLWDNLLNKAKTNGMNYLQLITWNDFGEGTMIEPTIEFGYLFLEKLQQFAGTIYDRHDLETIARMYPLRKSKRADKIAQKMLDQAFYNWVSLKPTQAAALIEAVAKRL